LLNKDTFFICIYIKRRGIIIGKQRYTCKDCGYNYTVDRKSTSKLDSVKCQALQLYLEGLRFKSIARILQVSHVSGYYWIKSYGSKLDNLRSDTKISSC